MSGPLGDLPAPQWDGIEKQAGQVIGPKPAPSRWWETEFPPRVDVTRSALGYRIAWHMHGFEGVHQRFAFTRRGARRRAERLFYEITRPARRIVYTVKKGDR